MIGQNSVNGCCPVGYMKMVTAKLAETENLEHSMWHIPKSWVMYSAAKTWSQEWIRHPKSQAVCSGWDRSHTSITSWQHHYRSEIYTYSVHMKCGHHTWWLLLIHWGSSSFWPHVWLSGHSPRRWTGSGSYRSFARFNTLWGMFKEHVHHTEVKCEQPPRKKHTLWFKATRRGTCLRILETMIDHFNTHKNIVGHQVNCTVKNCLRNQKCLQTNPM